MAKKSDPEGKGMLSKGLDIATAIIPAITGQKGDKVAVEKPAEEKPAVEKPAEEKPAVEKKE